MRIFKIFFGSLIGFCSFCMFISWIALKGEPDNLVLAIFFAVIAFLLIRKSKKDIARSAAKKRAMLLQPVNLWTGRYTFNSPEIPYRDAKDMQKRYTYMEAHNHVRIMMESFELAKTTLNFDTFCGRYDLCQRYAHTILLAEQAKVYKIKYLKAHDICTYIANSAYHLKQRALKECINHERKCADALKTEKGKINRYKKIQESLDRNKYIFDGMPEYVSTCEEIKNCIDILESTSDKSKKDKSSYDVPEPKAEYTFNSHLMPYQDAQEMKKQYSLAQATDEFQIMKESYEIAKNTDDLSTFCSKYNLCQRYARKILLAEQADVPGIYSLNAHNTCISIIDAADNLRLRAFYDCISSHILKADMFESENRKKLICYKSAMELMETYKDTFSDMKVYKEEYETTKITIEALDLMEKTREFAETFPEKLNDSIMVTTKRVADPDDDVVTQFLSLYGPSSQAICKGFTDLITDAYNTQDIDEKIYLLQRALEAYAYAKKWHYNHNSSGAKTFFQNTWERTTDHNGTQCTWEQATADNLMKYTMIRDNVIPWILDNAELGFKQTEIYKVFPDICQSELRDIISYLVKKGEISKNKKGNTYYISLPSTEMEYEAVN